MRNTHNMGYFERVIYLGIRCLPPKLLRSVRPATTGTPYYLTMKIVTVKLIVTYTDIIDDLKTSVSNLRNPKASCTDD